ncbi:hypothetical protein AT343_000103 [Shigella dysenteriae]|nr:hypothetical protein [Shigella dysenteriae]UGN72431.1 hypothetical protein Prokka_00011 [Shigella dysenteriae]HBP9461704.1 O58 family O-antigen flippase [Shigella dysenteriae]
MKINACLSFGTTLCKMITGLLFLAILSHSINNAEYSIIVTSIFFAQLLSVFVDGGINNEVLSLTNKSLDNDIDGYQKLSMNGAVRLVVHLFFSFVLSTYFMFADGWSAGGVFFWGYISGVLTSILETYSIKLKTEYKYIEDFILNIFCSLFVILSSFFIYIFPQCLMLYLVFFRLIPLAIYRKPLQVFKMIREIDYKLIRDNYIARKHYSIDSIATNINLQLDSFFLLLLFGRDMYAYYQPLNRLYNSCIGLSAAVVSFAIPYAHLLTSRIKKIYFLVFLFSSSAIIISLSYYFFSRDVVMVFFGEKFSMERQYIFLFSLLIFMRYLCASFGSYLMINGEQKKRALINLTITILCIPFILISETYSGILMVIIGGQILISYFYVLMIKRGVGHDK